MLLHVTVNCYSTGVILLSTAKIMYLFVGSNLCLFMMIAQSCVNGQGEIAGWYILMDLFIYMYNCIQ